MKDQHVGRRMAECLLLQHEGRACAPCPACQVVRDALAAPELAPMAPSVLESMRRARAEREL